MEEGSVCVIRFLLLVLCLEQKWWIWLSGKFFHPRVKNFVALPSEAATGHPDTETSAENESWAGSCLLRTWLSYGVLMALRKSEKSSFRNTHAWHPALFSSGRCVKMSDCAPSSGIQLPHGAVCSTRRLIIGNCLFRHRGQVLRKSSIAWLFPLILQAMDSFALFSAELMKPTQQKRARETNPGLWQLFGRKEKKWRTGLERKEVHGAT